MQERTYMNTLTLAHALSASVFLCAAYYKYLRDGLPSALGYAVSGILVVVGLLAGVLGLPGRFYEFLTVLLSLSGSFVFLLSTQMFVEAKGREKRFGWAWFVFTLSPVWAVIAVNAVESKALRYLPSLLCLAVCEVWSAMLLLKDKRPGSKKIRSGKLVFAAGMLLSVFVILPYPFRQEFANAALVCEFLSVIIQSIMAIGLIMVFF